jgi:hypothetical protein
MARSLTYSQNAQPISFAVPAVKGTAILPQTVALGVTVKVVRPNERYFGIMADHFTPGRVQVPGRLGSVWWDAENQRWAVERAELSGHKVIARFREEHLRQALVTAIIDTACEYVLDRDDLG